jgi:hypothetical protein
MDQKIITVDQLTKGNVLLNSCREVKGGKISIEVAEFIERAEGEQAPSLVSMINQSDERFSKPSGPRRGYATGTREDLEATFGITLPSAISKDRENPTALGILNPKVKAANGKTYEVHLQISESTKADINDPRPLEERAKNNGNLKNPLYFMYEGKPVFSKVNVVLGKPGRDAGTPNHVILNVKENGEFKPGCGLVSFEELVATMEGQKVSSYTKQSVAAEPRA